MQFEVKNIQGQKLKDIDLPDSIFGVEWKDHIVHQVVKAYLANKRQGTHATKTRSYVSGGGRKPFKQKGTGNARQGSTRSPLAPGGAISHGPQPRDYTQKTSKKSRQLALKMVLSNKASNGQLFVIDEFSAEKHSTKHMLSVMDGLGVKAMLVSDERKDDLVFKSTRNIQGCAYLTPEELNAEHLLKHESFVLTENALGVLQQRLGQEG
jgi:large subunit ribosomal protein L4